MKKLLLSIVALVIMLGSIYSQEQKEIKFNGFWEGKLKIGAVSLRLVLKTFIKDDGTTGAFLDSPDQGAKNIAVDKVIFTADSIKFSVSSVRGAYAGKIEKENSLIKGEWSQGEMKLPLDLMKVEQVMEARRPQTPQKPYPYNEEEVTLENKPANITLAGTLTYPKGEKKYPAVVLVSGSGPQDRDETILNHKPFLVIADYLTQHGIAVLRYDDRGVGKSKGNFSSATTLDFVTDALSAVEYLKTRNEIDIDKIGIIGHSEGGMIAPMAAANSDDVKFIVLLAGPGMVGKDLLLIQNRLIMKSQGMSDEEIEKNVKQTEVFDIIVNEPDSLKTLNKLEEFYKTTLAQLPEEEKKKPEISKQQFDQQVRMLLSPWFRFFLKYDPRPVLENLQIPVLALNGEKDLQVEPKQNLAGIEAALKNAGNKNYKIVELPGLNHLFQTTKIGTVSEYGELEETFSPAALNIIGEWVLKTIE